MRELEHVDSGVTLTDVFVAQAGVVMGVAPGVCELEDRAGGQRAHAAVEHNRRQFHAQQAASTAQRPSFSWRATRETLKDTPEALVFLASQ